MLSSWELVDTDSCAAQVTKVDLDMSSWVDQDVRNLGDGADEYPEFDFRVLGDGRSASARYANNSNYRNDSLIRKESTEIVLLMSTVTDNPSVRERCINR